MKKFSNIDELHAFLERRAKSIIKYYYSDWRNLDRPEVMKHTGLKTREVYIIFRESGSYLYTREDLQRDFPATVMDYYKDYRNTAYYKIDFCSLTAEKIPAGLPEDIRTENNERRKAA